MNTRFVIRTVGIIELSIGITTVGGMSIAGGLGILHKSLPVILFVLISSVFSATLGIGILRYREWARALVVFFSGYVILTKILIWAGLMRFSDGALTTIPPAASQCISILYHGLVIGYFTGRTAKNFFTTA